MRDRGDTGLAIEAVDHDYDGTPVIRGVDLSVAPGELLCLLGPSGCGKTTTLRIAAGLEAPSRGRVVLDGHLVSGDGVHLPPESRHVGFLFQDYALFPHLSVRRNVEFGLTALGGTARADRARHMLDQVGMAAYADAWPHQLSGGQQQRVALARALAPAPRLMLLDEPFSGLDKRMRDQIRDETLHVLKTNRVATLMVTHDPEEAMFMADRIAVMREGRIVQMDAPEQLYAHPADTFVAAFFGEINVIAGTVRGGAVATAVGLFAAPGVADGTAVEVVVRPEGVSLASSPAGSATVLAARLLGRSTLVHLCVHAADASTCHLHARTSGGNRPAEGEKVAILVDPAHVFVFPTLPAVA